MNEECGINKQIISFTNKRNAQAVTVPSNIDAVKIVQALDIQPPQMVIILSGGAIEAKFRKRQKERLHLLFSLGIARTAHLLNAVVIDGGTAAGVMQLMGQGIADQGYHTQLIGVVPGLKVTYPGSSKPVGDDCSPLDENHSHFVLLKEGSWGDETAILYQLGKVLGEHVPVITILINGGSTSKKEILQSTRYGWPVIVVKGSGRAANRLAHLWKRKTSFLGKCLPIHHFDPVEAEIIADCDIHLFPCKGHFETLVQLIVHLYRSNRYRCASDKALKSAWEVFARYDDNAKRQQKRYHREQNLLLWLSILTIVLVASQKQGLPTVLPWLVQPLHYTIVLVPICISILLAVASHFSAGNKWVMLRTSAETLKSKIYRYRASAEEYSDAAEQELSRKAKLLDEVNAISKQLVDTDIMDVAQYQYRGLMPPIVDGIHAIDDGVQPLSAEQYISLRLEDQQQFFQSRIQKLGGTAKRLRWTMYFVGGAGTFLAAIGLELWVALTTTIFTSCITYLEYRQIESTLRTYNIIASRLETIKNWWLSLSAKEQNLPANRNKLVATTETALQEERVDWASLMQDAVRRTSNPDRFGSTSA